MPSQVSHLPRDRSKWAAHALCIQGGHCHWASGSRSAARVQWAPLLMHCASGTLLLPSGPLLVLCRVLLVHTRLTQCSRNSERRVFLGSSQSRHQHLLAYGGPSCLSLMWQMVRVKQQAHPRALLHSSPHPTLTASRPHLQTLPAVESGGGTTVCTQRDSDSAALGSGLTRSAVHTRPLIPVHAGSMYGFPLLEANLVLQVSSSRLPRERSTRAVLPSSPWAAQCSAAVTGWSSGSFPSSLLELTRQDSRAVAGLWVLSLGHSRRALPCLPLCCRLHSSCGLPLQNCLLIFIRK